MKYLLFFCALLLASCARPNTAPPPKAEPIGLDSPIELHLHADDSGYTPSQVVRRRLFGLLPKNVASSPKKVASDNLAAVPRKCKGCTFIIGDNTTLAGKKAQVAAGTGAVANVVGKKAGPAVVASDSVQQNTVGGPGNILATNGNNNTPTLSAPVQQPPDWRAALATGFATPIGKVAAVALVVLMLYGGYRLWPLLRRKKSDTPIQA